MIETVTAATTGDLTVLATVKAGLKITTTDDDDFLTDIIHRASGAIAAYCLRDTFGRETYRQTEWLDDGLRQIILDRDIDIEISSITVDGVALADGDWKRDGRRIRRMANGRPTTWAGGSTVVIEYQAGYELLGTLPYDLEQACITLVTDAYRARDRDRALRSERVLDLSEVTYFGSALNAKSGGLPPDIAAQVEGYSLIPLKTSC